MYTQFRSSVLGRVIGDGQCVSLVDDNSSAYIEYLYPGVSWTSILPSVPSAKDLAGKSNQYLEWIANDHSNPNQLPEQGDIMVFGATPEPGYTNQFNNPDGHCGVCDSASPSGYTLLQQNSPTNGSPANLKTYPWKFRPCLGWYHPLTPGATTPPPTPAPAPTPTPTVHTIHFPQTFNPVHLYNVGGPYVPSKAKAVLVPSQFAGGITEQIIAVKPNDIYTIQTQMYGIGDVWMSGSNPTVT